MKTYLKKLSLAGVLGGLLASQAGAQVTHIVFVGGNSTAKLIQDRWANLFGGTLTTNPTNTSLIFRYTGASVPGVVGTVTADFNLTGGAGAVLDLKNGTPVVLQDNTKAAPTAIITAVSPETIGIDSSPFTALPTVIVPFVYVKGTTTPNDLGAITNLTQRNAALLESAAGQLTTEYFAGGPVTARTPTNTLYFVGRNSLSAVRQIVDANIYYSGSVNNYTTNASGLPIKYLSGGQPWGAASGGEVVALLKAITNSIGTLSPQDINGTVIPLNYEGVTFSTTNVINGQYPIWSEEQYLYWPNGVLAATTDQQTVINSLVNAVADINYGHTNSLFVGKFVEPGDLQVSRTGDGGPITPN
jgi:hypothetical protein